MKDGVWRSSGFHCDTREIVARSGSTFVNGMRVLAAPRRQAIFALYALCRIVDDIVDEAGPPEGKIARLDLWHAELDRVFDGTPDTPVGRDLAKAVRRYALPRDEFYLILDGMRMDLTPIVGPERGHLDDYIRRVAGTVGILSMHIFGAWRGDASHAFALSLAEAMQITNILRDIEEDAGLGRIYLPRDILETAGIPADPARIIGDSALPEARRALGRSARQAFDRVERQVRFHERRRLLPALFMMGPYERLLARMESDWSRPAPARARWRKALDGARCAALCGSFR